jgi:hypothetical protein
MPRVSVIIPLFNKAPWVARCLRSVLGQTFRDIEVIVIDDGSTDGSAAIVNAQADARLRMFTQPNAGPGAARNAGVALASGEMLAFLDADDVWPPWYLAESVRRLESQGSTVGGLSWAVRLHPGGASSATSWRRAGIPDGLFRLSRSTDPSRVVAMLAHMFPSATVLWRDAFQSTGGFYQKGRCVYGEDAYLWLKLLLRGPHLFCAEPATTRDLQASELAHPTQRARPIEPFLLDPGELESDCPPDLRGVLRAVLTIRALKTASVCGYWGLHDQSRELVQRFASPLDYRLPYFAPALLSCTPVAGWLGALAREVRSRVIEARPPAIRQVTSERSGPYAPGQALSQDGARARR